MKVHVILFINTGLMRKHVTIHHGSGGKLTKELVSDFFAKRFGMNDPLTDSAILYLKGGTLAFTTDSYVVDPVFFPGGDIGKLAVCGTINDLAVSGAVPEYIAASFIIEEGFPVKDLDSIVCSMAEEALIAEVKIVTGDTKVVEKGKCDKIFITTSGTGILAKKYKDISTGRKVKAGDKLIINGSIGNHAIAVLGARNNISFSSPVISDCASLNHLINSVLDKCSGVRFMRDITRGGLGTILNELSGIINSVIEINESAVPVDDPVRGICEIMGFDPLYLANEGKVLFVAGKSEHELVLDILRSHPLGKNAEIIGEILPENKTLVILRTSAGGMRILDMPSGIQVPRIC
jgi:hydrogenase expression/formation protein HypE